MVFILLGGSPPPSPEPYMSPPATPPPPPPVLTTARRKAKEKEDAKQYKIERAARIAACKVNRAAMMAARKEAREKQRRRNMEVVPGFTERSAKMSAYILFGWNYYKPNIKSQRAEYTAKRKVQLDKAECDEKAVELELHRSARAKEKVEVSYHI